MQMILEQTTVNGRFGDYSLDEKQELLVDANDSLLDRAHQNMDILEGIREMVEIESTYHRALSGSWNRPPPSSAPPPEQRSSVPVLHMAKVTTRPQILFKDKIDNSNTPWVPGIKEKPNSLKPLAVLIEVNEEGYESYSHPYEYELDHWSPPPNQLKYQRPELPRSLENTPYSYIETPEQLDLMMAELKDQNALAVDLEHHSYRSFMGFTCTLQISTKAKDYIVDALTLRHRLHILNEIFTNPKIVKVFHGAENDIEWLQRDLAVYVVNMFDTYQAAKLLQCPKLNLAYLLHHYCQLDTDKHFQLYDWRTRPLSEKAVIYAREDTHYLLYIYSRMTNELLKASNNNTNLLESVYQRSTETCKRKYTKPLLEEDSHMVTYRKGKRLMDNRQLFALKELYLWRDTIARREDESPGYVLPNHMMLQMADTLPREMQGVLACCNPIPTLVRQYVMELHQIMLRAREQPLVKVVCNWKYCIFVYLSISPFTFDILLEYLNYFNRYLALSKQFHR
ncbi:hypothetical protein AAG570_005147 [Ranatra chinensis]|uniref:Exosome complex component 10 homolog n=1 Tax=Ranatra chinensis TaxID=642074 RepID=A0ABD0YN75_9HEMI